MKAVLNRLKQLAWFYCFILCMILEVLCLDSLILARFLVYYFTFSNRVPLMAAHVVIIETKVDKLK